MHFNGVCRERYMIHTINVADLSLKIREAKELE